MAITMFVRHKVKDYENWKRVYDEFAPVRQEKGVTGASVHRDANDPNTIIVTHQFNHLNAATAFANSEERPGQALDTTGVNHDWHNSDHALSLPDRCGARGNRSMKSKKGICDSGTPVRAKGPLWARPAWSS